MPGLEQRLAELTSGDDQRAEAAAKYIHTFGQPAVLELCLLLDDNNSDNRWWAVRALAEYQTKNVTPHLITALQDSDQDVRHCAVMAMRILKDPITAPHLIRLLGDEDRTIARLAADSLIAIGKESVPDLLEVLENGDRATQVESARTLALIADYAAVSALFNLLDSDSALLEYWANEGLTNLGIGMSFFEPE